MPEYVVVYHHPGGPTLVWLGRMKEPNDTRAKQFGAGALNSLLEKLDLFKEIKDNAYIYWEGTEDFELFCEEGRKNRIRYQKTKPEDTKPRRVISVQTAYPYPPASGLLRIKPFEWRNYKTKSAKIKWMMWFAKKYGITTWKRKDFQEMSPRQLRAVWARYYCLDKTAAQIAAEIHVPFEDRQSDLSIGQWPNPYLPEGQLELPL